jgi:hypothetical protein
MCTAARFGAGALAALALACGPVAPSQLGSESEGLASTGGGAGLVEKVTGEGTFVHPDFGSVSFSFAAVRHKDGRVTGQFEQDQHDLGFLYKGEVTCFAVDEINHRAWIGGVLTESNDPDPVTEIGDDAWFRVLDLGKPKEGPDRSTFLGFEGAIVTSEEYCQLQIWPPDNARTWPVVEGNLKIH